MLVSTDYNYYKYISNVGGNKLCVYIYILVNTADGYNEKQ